MPTYDFKACENCGRVQSERNVPIQERDHQFCVCGEPLDRLLTFEGLTWAPTAGGMR